ncbi:hypothetical protein CAPTEDRAFT_77621, partial [Capitella teleta]
TRTELLDLRFNQIAQMANDTFEDMDETKVLHLSHNDITEIITGQFSSMLRLESIYIEHTKLKTIQPGAFPASVQKISIQYADNLVTIANGTFTDLPNLHQIDIENNP